MEREAERVYRTSDDKHPGVAVLRAEGARYIAGPVRAVDLPDRPEAFQPYLLPPAESRAAFAERGWKTIVGFQTRNPIHRAHEYITKAALEGVDGLFIHPLISNPESDDIPAFGSVALLRDLDPELLPSRSGYCWRSTPRPCAAPAAPGHLPRPDPQELQLSRFIVGRDRAGVGNYYRTYDAQTYSTSSSRTIWRSSR